MLHLAKISIRSICASKSLHCMFPHAEFALTGRSGSIAHPFAISSPRCSSYVNASRPQTTRILGVYRKQLPGISAQPTGSLRLSAVAAASGASTAEQSSQRIPAAPSSTASPAMVAKEYSSRANATAVKVTHNHFDLVIDFDRKVIIGSAQVHPLDSTCHTLTILSVQPMHQSVFLSLS